MVAVVAQRAVVEEVGEGARCGGRLCVFTSTVGGLAQVGQKYSLQSRQWSRVMPVGAPWAEHRAQGNARVWESVHVQPVRGPQLGHWSVGRGVAESESSPRSITLGLGGGLLVGVFFLVAGAVVRDIAFFEREGESPVMSIEPSCGRYSRVRLMVASQSKFNAASS